MNQIVFTHHARQRVYEFGLDMKKAIRLLLNAQIEKPLHLGKYRMDKYHNKAGIIYRNGTFVFTILDEKCKFTGKDISLVITLFDQRMNLKG